MTASTILGRVAMIPKGIWNAQSAYSKLNVVTIGGSSYLAVQDVPAGTSVSDTAYWQLLAEKGTSGGVGQLADEFSANNSYAVGDYCSYNQDVYRFINPHSGAWDVSDVVLVSIANELKQKVTESEVSDLIEAGTASKAETLETAREIEVNLESDTTASFDGSANISTGVTGILPASHGGTGNANGTASALTTPRTIRTNLESTSTASFDGSANVTPGVSGVLPKANGGTGNANGTADKLTTGRTIRTNLGSTSTATFDGSANITPGVTGTLGTANGGTGNANGTVAKLTNARTFRTNLESTSTASFDGSANVTLGVTGKLRLENGGTGKDNFHDAIEALGGICSMAYGNNDVNFDTTLLSCTHAKLTSTNNAALRTAWGNSVSYAYLIQIFYNASPENRTTSSQRLQIAFPHLTTATKFSFRVYDGGWSAWKTFTAS